jgi:predicted ATPase
LSASIGDNQKLFHVVLGLRRYYLHCGGLRTARELGEQLIILGTEMHDSSHVVGTLYLSRAHFMQSEVFYCLGEFLSAREHGQEGGRIYAPQQRDKHVLLYGNDTGICCGVQEAMALWQLGWPNQAIERVQAGLQVARELSHPFTLAFVLCFATTIHQLCRDVETVQEQVGELLHISEKHGFALFQALGTVLQGWTLSEKRSIQRSDSGLHGDARRPMDVYMQSDAADRVSAGIAALRAIGVQRTLPKSLAFLAEANGRAGKIKEGLDRVHEAREWVEKTDERTYDAELFRLEGELLLLGQGDGEEAEACFLHALEVARCQSAKSWELRAAMSLSRLWQQQGKTAAALALLQEVYEWFTEGFDTSDLKDARTLLEELD